MKLKCLQCGKILKGKRRKYCSSKCADKYYWHNNPRYRKSRQQYSATIKLKILQTRKIRLEGQLRTRLKEAKKLRTQINSIEGFMKQIAKDNYISKKIVEEYLKELDADSISKLKAGR